MTNKEFEEYFWKRVDTSAGMDGCWPWKLYANRRQGYGIVQNPHSPYRFAHRVAYALTNGQIPPGMVIRHRCDFPPCCNPTHLELGTHQDNVADTIARGRKRNRGQGPGPSRISLMQFLDKKKISPEERFWRQANSVGIPELCWEWTGHRINGYGQASWQGKIMKAHRVSYQLVHGSIPQKMVVRHMCRNRACINPDHLRIGSQKENVMDNVLQGVHSHVLNADQATQIPTLLDDGHTVAEIASLFNVSTGAIHAVIRGDNWRHLGLDLPTHPKDRSWKIKSRLTAREVTEIRKKYQNGYSIRDLAKLFEMSVDQIRRVVKGEAHNTKGTQEAAELRVVRGELHHCAKLSAEEVTQMRSLFANGERLTRIAKQFEVSLSTTRNAVSGRTYSGVPGAIELPGKLKGGNHPRAKLQEDQVREMRKLANILTADELTKRYKVSKRTVENILRFQTWRDIH